MSSPQRCSVCFGIAIVVLFAHEQVVAQSEDYSTPKRVSVLPVFLVPRGGTVPTSQESKVLMQHLSWARDHYEKALRGRSTFDIAEEKPRVVRLRRAVSYYKSLPKGEAACHIVAELLDHFEVSRFKCPWVFCGVVVNRRENWPVGGGRPINGGYGRGGGIVMLSSYSFMHPTSIQATVRHELGHAFGLPHVDVYGYDQSKTPSMMAYHKPFKTLAFRKAPANPKFIPEDLRGLALNPNVFAKLTFDAKLDIPANYRMFWKAIPLGPMNLPGRPDYEPVLQTDSGEDSGTKLAHINAVDPLPSIGPGINFRKKHMWLSKPAPDGKINLSISFPGEVALTGMTIHTGHSGRYNVPKQIQIEAIAGEQSRQVASTRIKKGDVRITFPQTTSRSWRIRFLMKPNKKVCVRAVEYFANKTQLFPPQVPYDWRGKLGIDLPVFSAAK